MRRIRRVIQRAYITSFNQFLELKTSNQTLNNVFCRMGNGSNLQCVVRGKSSKAASVPSDATSGRRKFGKRIPRNERKLMVESYVNKYREMNDGKFPTATDTNKNVGGSYYIVKDILGALKYSSKLSCSDKMDTTALPNNAESMSISQPTHDEGPSQQNSGILMRDELKGANSLSKSERTLSTDEIVDGPLSKDAQNEITLITQPSNDEGPSSFQQNTDVLSIDAETQSSQRPVASKQQQSVDSDETSERGLDKVPAENAPEKKSSLWQNLKSLTSGFFDKWRR